MMFQLQNIPLYIGITQQVNAVAIAVVFFQNTYWVVNTRRRCWLIVSAVSIVNRECRIESQGCIKHTIVSIFLMNLAQAQRSIQLQGVVQHTLLGDKTATIFRTSTGNIQTIGLLVVQTRTVETILGSAVDREVLIHIVGSLAGDQVVPVGVITIIFSTLAATELISREYLWLVLGYIGGYPTVISHIDHTLRT